MHFKYQIWLLSDSYEPEWRLNSCICFIEFINSNSWSIKLCKQLTHKKSAEEHFSWSSKTSQKRCKAAKSSFSKTKESFASEKILSQYLKSFISTLTLSSLERGSAVYQKQQSINCSIYFTFKHDEQRQNKV